MLLGIARGSRLINPQHYYSNPKVERTTGTYLCCSLNPSFDYLKTYHVAAPLRYQYLYWLYAVQAHFFFLLKRGKPSLNTSFVYIRAYRMCHFPQGHHQSPSWRTKHLHSIPGGSMEFIRLVWTRLMFWAQFPAPLGIHYPSQQPVIILEFIAVTSQNVLIYVWTPCLYGFSQESKWMSLVCSVKRGA